MAAISDGGSQGSGTGLGANSHTSIFAAPTRKGCRGNADMRACVHARGDQTFRLNVLSSTDDWATYEIVKQVASSTVTNDGGTTNFVNVAELTDWILPSTYDIEIHAVGGTLAWKVDYREVAAGKS